MTPEPIMQYGGDLSHLMVKMFTQAMHAEEIDGRQVRRVVNRVMFGTPEPDRINRTDEFGKKT